MFRAFLAVSIQRNYSSVLSSSTRKNKPSHVCMHSYFRLFSCLSLPMYSESSTALTIDMHSNTNHFKLSLSIVLYYLSLHNSPTPASVF